MARAVAFLLVLFALPTFSVTPAALVGAKLASETKVRQALAFVRQNEPKVIEYQIRLTEVPAPPFEEARRAEVYRQMFAQRGLKNVRIDREGNVIGIREGRSSGPRLVMSAHLDTVFPPATDVKVRRDGPLLKAPGIGDDGRGLAVLLGVLDALNSSQLPTEGPIAFVGTVGEEGLGDLRGVKHLFQNELKGGIDRFISIDGTGSSITNVGVGSYRYRVIYSGPGGHSFGSFGNANPIHALGRLIDQVARFEVSVQPKATFNVGRISGGTSVNSIAFEAMAEVDMRSADKDSLETLHYKLRMAAKEALEQENERWENKGAIKLKLDQVGYRPPGRLKAQDPVTKAVVSATRALGLDAPLREGSTDANVGMAMGIPSLTIGGGGSSSGAHSPSESFDTTDSWKGTQRALLVALALSQELE